MILSAIDHPNLFMLLLILAGGLIHWTCLLFHKDKGDDDDDV